MKKFILALPSLVDVVSVADDQGITEAKQKAVELATEFLNDKLMTKELTEQDNNMLLAWGEEIVNLGNDDAVTEGSKIVAGLPIPGADSMYFGASLFKEIDPTFEGGKFGFAASLLMNKITNLISNPNVARASFWDADEDPASAFYSPSRQ